jgi:hypothetical protein
MALDWEETLRGFEDNLDGVASIGSIARAAIGIRYQANVLSADDEQVVLMLDTGLWDELDSQIEMFMTYMGMSEELQEIQPPTEGAGA